MVPCRVAVPAAASAASGFRVLPSRKNSGALSAATAPLARTLPVRTDLPGSTTKFVSSTLVLPSVSEMPQPSCLMVPWT